MQDNQKSCYWTFDELKECSDICEKVIKMYPIKKFVKGDIIYEQGQEGRNVYLLLKGRVELSYTYSSGRKKIISISEPRQFLGEVVFDRLPYLLTCRCLTEVEAVLIDSQSVTTWDKDMLCILIYSLMWKLRVTINQLTNQTFVDANNRIEMLLEGLFNVYGRSTHKGIEMELPLTHQDIADIVGSSRSRVSQSIGKMSKEGKISVKGGTFILRDY